MPKIKTHKGAAKRFKVTGNKYGLYRVAPAALFSVSSIQSDSSGKAYLFRPNERLPAPNCFDG